MKLYSFYLFFLFITRALVDWTKQFLKATTLHRILGHLSNFVKVKLNWWIKLKSLDVKFLFETLKWCPYKELEINSFNRFSFSTKLRNCGRLASFNIVMINFLSIYFFLIPSKKPNLLQKGVNWHFVYVYLCVTQTFVISSLIHEIISILFKFFTRDDNGPSIEIDVTMILFFKIDSIVWPHLHHVSKFSTISRRTLKQTFF